MHPTLSVVTPAFNERENLVELYGHLKKVLDDAGVSWEWIIVDDRSRDGSFIVAADMARHDPRVRAIRLARNFGSHMAVTCGLRNARGDATVILAADLQDPPKVVADLLEKWRAGAKIVWATRRQRAPESAIDRMGARLYYWILRRTSNLQSAPPNGVDFFLVDRRVVDVFAQSFERNVSVFALITWMGFTQDAVVYDRPERTRGRSSWNVRRKVKLVIDTLTAFSSAPLRIASVLGLTIGMLAVIYAMVAVANFFIGSPPPGWTAVMAAVLLMGSFQLIILGVLGEYIWRITQDAKGRPPYVIEEDISASAASPDARPDLRVSR